MAITRSLTIAGSDNSGGAGIQADLKTFSALGAYGMSVITALTAQNTMGVQAFWPTSTESVYQQFNSIVEDIAVDSAKVGMLATKEIVLTVADCLKQYSLPFVVLDTVMVAKGGHSLLQADTVDAIREYLLPLSDLITPNLPEAAALLKTKEAINEEGMISQGKALLKFGCRAVLMKGGHLRGEESPDWLITCTEVHRFGSKRILTQHTHGTGCTLSAAITALQPKLGLFAAIEAAKTYLNGALKAANRLNIGHGIGPTHHFFEFWST